MWFEHGGPDGKCLDWDHHGPRELNRLDGRVSTSLDLSNTVSHSFRQLMDIIWNLNTCLTLNEKFARQKPIYKRSATSEFCGKSYVLSKRHRLYKQKTDR